MPKAHGTHTAAAAHAPRKKLDILAYGLHHTHHFDAARDVRIHLEQQIAHALRARLAERVGVAKEI